MTVTWRMLLGVCVLHAVKPACGALLYEQPHSSTGAVAAVSSQLATTDVPTFDRAYDNFVLSFDAVIKDFHWYGSYSGTPGSPTFTIEFWDSRIGGALGTEPNTSGTPLLSFTTADDANETSIGGAVYLYDVFLPLADHLFVAAGTEIWVSVYANLDRVGDEPSWGWATADWVDGGYSDFDLQPDGILDDAEGRAATLNGNMFPESFDFAFQVTGDFQPRPAVVPEPSSVLTWSLLGLGVTIVGWCRVRGGARRR